MVQFNNKLLLFVTGVIYTSVYHLTLAQSNNIPLLIGSNVSRRFRPFNMDGFYLNTARPAPGNGVITGFNYCFYGRRDNSKSIYQALVALYRPTGGRIRSYERISDTVVISKQPPFTLGFNCTFYELNVGVQVLEGDVVGACIYDTSTIGQLDLISESLTNESYTLLSESVHHADCDTGVLPAEILADTLEGTRQRVILHVSAEIFPGFAPNTDQMGANTAAATRPQDAYTGPGEYLTKFATDLPNVQDQPKSIFIIIVTVVGGLVFIAISALIVVIIVVVCCLIAQKRKCDKKQNCNNFGIIENTAYTVASRATVTPDRNDEERSTSEGTSLSSPEPYYDYIMNSAMRGLQLRANTNKGNNTTRECFVQQNVAYSSPETVLKTENKSPSKDEYVMFIP